MSEVHDLVEQLGKRLGVDGLSLNQRDSVQLLLTADTLVNLEDYEGTLIASARVCSYPPPEHQAALFAILLEAHAFGIATEGASFCTTRAKGQVVLYQRLHPRTIDELEAALDRYCGVLAHWKEQLSTLGA